MKTLDEVIKAFEICIDYYCSNAEHDVCPYFGESDMGCMKEPEKDALHYLREFQGLSKMWNDMLDKEQENQPLTWDELRTMEGKPVWVECKFYSHQWAIIGEVTENRIRFYGPRLVDGEPQEEMGVTWQAFRKER